jgi:hypothetical protein
MPTSLSEGFFLLDIIKRTKMTIEKALIAGIRFSAIQDKFLATQFMHLI